MSMAALLWGTLGFLSGYLAGTFWGFGRKAVTPPPRKGVAVTVNKRWSTERLIGPVVLLLAILMGVQYMLQVSREREIIDCQAGFNSAFSRQLSIRSELSSQAQANVDSIILSIGKLVSPTDAQPSPAEQVKRAAEYRKLFKDFAAESAAISKKRNETPLPKLPDCGDNTAALPATLAVDLARIEALEANLDASRQAILASQVPSAAPEVTASPVRTVIVRGTSSTSRPDPTPKPPVVIVRDPAPASTPSPAPAPPVDPPPALTSQTCLLNLLGLCI